MKFKVLWGNEPNTADGTYDVAGLVEQLESLAYANCMSQWEEEFWCAHSVAEFALKAIKMRVGSTLYIPYDNSECEFELLSIEKMSEGE
jgi:hypothetical protein